MSAASRFAATPSARGGSFPFEAPGGGRFYLASNASYCEATDATCSRCRAAWTRAYPDGYFGSQADRERRREDVARVMGDVNATAATLACVGANGCFCLAYCELASYRATLVDTCSSSSGWRSATAVPQTALDDRGAGGSSATFATGWIVYVLVVAGVLVIVIPMAIATRKYLRAQTFGTSALVCHEAIGQFVVESSHLFVHVYVCDGSAVECVRASIRCAAASTSASARTIADA